MKTRYYILTAVAAALLCSCNSFLDSDNLTKKNNSNFPKTEEDAEESLTGCYNMLRNENQDEAQQNLLIISEILSDDRFAGGGPDDRYAQALDRLKKSSDNMFDDLWKNNYTGIYRCNMLLESLPNITFTSDADKNQIEGETRFLRAFYYFNLCKTFGSVPLIVTSQSDNPAQASPDSLYTQIGTDLQKAVALLPSTKATEMATSRLGHATKWAAEGLLARTFLFYTGYYEKETMGSVTKAEVVKDLNDCIVNSGHKLMPDFRDLWPYSNKYTKPDYAYAKDNDLNWYGEDGGNYETIFAIRYSPKSVWGTSNTVARNNQCCLFFSPRETDGSVANNFPLGIGWGFGTVNSKMLETWKSAEPKDLRIKGSIFDTSDEAPDYVWGADKQMNETGLWQKKYAAINVKTITKVGADPVYENYSRKLYPSIDTDYQLNNIQDIVVLRFADVLLMYSELTKTTDGINLVRGRAGLDPIAGYTDEALRNERRWELAFEGIRWYDLLRWHIAADALAKQNGVSVQDNLEQTTMAMSDIAQRVKDTGGFLQIPQSQIDLSNGVLKQNAGWTGDNLLY